MVFAEDKIVVVSSDTPEALCRLVVDVQVGAGVVPRGVVASGVLAHHGVVRSGVDLCGRVVERRGEHCNKQCGDNFFHDGKN